MARAASSCHFRAVMQYASPTDQFFETVNAFQRTSALNAAVELGLFTAIASGAEQAETIAARCSATRRGIRILCDYLVTIGLLGKSGERYRLAPCAELYLAEGSPWYLGRSLGFLNSPAMLKSFADLGRAVRGGEEAGVGFLAPEHAAWKDYARAMMPLAAEASNAIAALLAEQGEEVRRILDIAAGHGAFGIAVAVRHVCAEVVAVDWANVLAVARENAVAAGLDGRYKTLAGDATAIVLGADYDVALVANFLHHFDRSHCVALLRRVCEALREGGRLAVLEFVANEDRVSPPVAAAFAITMLATTPAGDVYTLNELQGMLEEAGFAAIESQSFPAPQTILIARKPV